jgi:hypothetical protein
VSDEELQQTIADNLAMSQLTGQAVCVFCSVVNPDGLDTHFNGNGRKVIHYSCQCGGWMELLVGSRVTDSGKPPIVLSSVRPGWRSAFEAWSEARKRDKALQQAREEGEGNRQ